MARTKKPVLKFKLLHKNAKLPSYAHEDDAGFDLYSPEAVKILPRSYKLINLGIAAEIPREYFVSLRGKGSLAGENGIDILGGVVDSGYRGEWAVILANLDRKVFEIKVGDKIAQGILQSSPQAKIIAVKKLSETKRGTKGFGSTGRK